MNNNLTYYNNLKKYFINLDNRKDRLKDTKKQVGDDFIRIPAVYGKALHFREIDQFFDMKMCNKIYKINQTKAQASATISQYKVFKTVLDDDSIKDNDFVLICEDDNTYAPFFKEKLDQLLRFLDSPQFNNAQIIILKYLILDDLFDYYPALKLYNSKHTGIRSPDVEWAKKNEPSLVPVLEFMVNTKSSKAAAFRDDFYRVMRVSNHKRHNWCFDYQNISEDTTGKLYSQTQRLFTCYYIYPFSASCYLIRKSTIRKIVSKYKKPWWYADDFKQLVPVQDILFASPFLAYDSPTGNESSIISEKNGEFDEFVSSNFWYNKVIKKKHIRKFNRIKSFPKLIKWHYSKNFIKRKISYLLQHILFIR